MICLHKKRIVWYRKNNNSQITLAVLTRYIWVNESLARSEDQELFNCASDVVKVVNKSFILGDFTTLEVDRGRFSAITAGVCRTKWMVEHVTTFTKWGFGEAFLVVDIVMTRT